MQLFTFALFVLCIACSQLETAWAGSNNGASLASARLKATSPLTVAKKTKLPTSLLSRDDMSLPHVEDVSSTLAMREKLFLLRAGSSGDFDWRYFVAGGVCAACSHGITTPLDVIKTRMQTFPEKYNKGVFSAARDIVATEGVGFLLAGLGPTVVGYGFEGALKFGCYETFKKLFAHLTPSKMVNFLLASVVAGAVASIVLVPMEEARVKMVGEPSWAKENTVTAIARLIREKGIVASFGGLSAMLSKQIPYTMGKQVSFDIIAGMVHAVALNLFPGQDMKLFVSLTSAFLASIVACIFSQPGDMILTATYNAQGCSHGHGHGHCNHGPSGGMADDSFAAVVRSIYKRHGLAGFFLGIEARLAHVASIITVQLVIYDFLKIALGLPVTGTH